MKPDDDYLLRLGLAHYCFQYVEWGVIYALHRVTQEPVSELATKMPGRLARLLNDAWEDVPELAALARRYEALVIDRQHLAHSHPATQRCDEGNSQQRLRRHDVGHPARPTTIAWITPEWLDQFVVTAMALNLEIQLAAPSGEAELLTNNPS